MKKDDQLLIKINKQVKQEFIKMCEKNDTSASREVRRLIKEYMEGQK